MNHCFKVKKQKIKNRTDKSKKKQLLLSKINKIVVN